MKKFFLLLLVATLSLTACVENRNTASELTSREEVDAYPQIVIPTMTVYNGDLFQVEAPAVPKGYKPVFMHAYLRHGSRLEASAEYPVATYNYFKKADEAGLLTPLGKEVYAYMEWNHLYHLGRIGDLTDIGFNQHKDIAKRYYKAFPMLFKGKSEIESIGSSELRAAMSMVGFNEGLKECNPRLRNHQEATERVTAVIRPQKSAHNSLYPAAEEKAYKKFLADNVYPNLVKWGEKQSLDHAKKAMFTDPDKVFALFSEPAFKVMVDIYKRLAFAQNLGYDSRELTNKIFKEEERYLIYKHENARWYYRCGTAIHPILANNMAQSRIYVDYVVERVDAALSGESNYKANLCFGHDLNIIPIQNIFGLDNMPLYFSLENNTVDYIAEHWRGYKITPKAANIFLIFYRNKEGKVLVRPQMNERDVEMPIESETPHFYEWEKVKELAYARLAEIDELKKGAF